MLGVLILCCFCPVGDREVGVCGSSVLIVCMGLGCWGWTGCLELVLALSVARDLGPQSCLGWLLWFVVVGVGLLVLVMLCVLGVSGSLVSVVVQ